MVLTRLFLLAAGAILLGGIFWAAPQADLFTSFQSVIADPWGLVMLIDLYVGFLVLTVLAFYLERNVLVALAWVIPLYILGNIVLVLYVVLRGLPRLVAHQNERKS